MYCMPMILDNSPQKQAPNVCGKLHVDVCLYDNKNGLFNFVIGSG